MKEGSYLLTNIIPTYDGHYELDFQTTTVNTNAAAYLGGRAGQSPAGLIFSHGSGNVLVTDAFGQRYSITYRVEDNTHYKYVFNNKVFTLYKNGEVVETHTFTSSTNSGAALAIKAINIGDSIDFAGEGFYFYGFKAWNNQGQLIADYIPATKLQGLVTGIYDKVTNTFLTATSGEWSSGPAVQVPTPDTPMDIVCNNGVVKVNNQGQIYTDGTQETVTVTGKNIASAFQRGTIGGDGSITAINIRATNTDLIRIKPSGTYTFSVNGTNYIVFECYMFDKNKNKIGFTPTINATTKTITFNANVYYIRYSVRKTDNSTVSLSEFTTQLELGSTATDYEPYFNGGSADAEMLLSVGDYKDEQEVLAGNITRNIGIKVLDGTENFRELSTPHVFGFGFQDIGAAGTNPICSHYPEATITLGVADMPDKTIKGHGSVVNSYYIKDSRFSTVEQFKQFLADQYANGTPVIVIYLLATATTESVTAQPLSIQAGTNIITAEGSIDNLPLEVSYKATA